MLFKSVLRTIKKSFGRYLAILAIIALGVGFFSGLRVSETAMIKTADDYLNELNLYDVRLISTLGLTDEDVEAFSGLEGVDKAFGSVSTDFIYHNDSGSDSVFHAHMLLDGANGVDIVSGRLPESPDECVLDNLHSAGSSVGDKIVLSKDNSQDTFDKFAYDEYTVVGLVNSSEYINFERGTTSLGNGSVSGYVYLMPEGFATDYYTEIYLTLPQRGEIYSSGYEARLEALKTSAETLLRERADMRYEELLSDGQKEISDAQAELDDKSAELADAKFEIDDGWETYRSEKSKIESELADAKEELDKVRAELDDSWAKLEAAKADPISKIPEIKAQLDDSEAELTEAEKTYSEKLDEYNQACADAEQGFADTEKELLEAQNEYDDGLKKISEAESEIEDAKKELADLKRASIYSLDRLTNVGYASLENDTSIVSGVAKVFPLFFFLVAALVCITTMTRMVSEKRTENGVLKAMGYDDMAIISQYLIYAGSASAVGCVLGFLLGSKLMPMALWQVYKIMYAINRPIEFVLDWKLFAVCAGMYLLCSLGATWLVCRRDLQENAASLIRPKSPAAGKRILIERIDFIWRHVKFLHKVSIRNILRYKKRMVMMIIGIGGCTALLLTGFGIRDSIQPIIDYQYDEITVYDAEVSFTCDMDETLMSEFESSSSSVAEDVLFLHSEKLDFITEDSDNAPASVNLNVYTDEPDGFIDLHRGNDKVAYPQKGEAVINNRLASEFGVKAGDEIILRDSDYNTIRATVSGIFDNYIYDYVYISSETYAQAIGKDCAINTAYVCFKDGEDEHSAGAALLNCENVAGAFINSDMRTRVGNMLSSLDYIVLIVLVCAGTLAFIVLYNLTNITITERSREIATLKVLGFYQKEQNSYVFRENIILTALASVAGIPMGIALLNYVMAQIKISSMYFGCRLNPESYIISIAITFAFTVIVDLALTVKTKRINMAEAMKAIE